MKIIEEPLTSFSTGVMFVGNNELDKIKLGVKIDRYFNILSGNTLLGILPCEEHDRYSSYVSDKGIYYNFSVDMIIVKQS